MKTPLPLRFPYPSVRDHGLCLSRDFRGNPDGYLHSVTIQEDAVEAQDRAIGSGYWAKHGHVDADGRQNWLWERSYRLTTIDLLAAY